MSAKSRYRRVTVVQSQKDTDKRSQVIGTFSLEADSSEGAQAAAVFVVPGPGQPKEWLGFGGSFTEASAVTLKRMSAARQQELLEAYFGCSGLGYTLGRLPMGSCDFGLGSWTCGNLVEGDKTLQGFSLARYEEAILPMLRRAADLAGPLTLLASPWSPPPWMKTSGRWKRGGKLLPEWRAAWALHYVRFAQEMAHAGVPLWGFSVQNEAEAATPWESCIWSAEEERDFVRDFLGPALERARLGHLKVIVWDHNRDGMLERAVVAYSDPEAAKYIWGIGYHWYGDPRFEWWPGRAEVTFDDGLQLPAAQRLPAEARAWLRGGKEEPGAPRAHFPELRGRLCLENVRRTAELRGDKHVLFTEGCQELGGRPMASMLGDWKCGERYGMNIIADLNAGCEGWIDWNLCLDETGGPNHAGNLCIAPIICDTRADELLLQPAYWYLGHFARHIRPGARRLVCSSSRDALEATAFVNCSGNLAVVVMNQTDTDIYFWLKIAESGALLTDAPAHSITTFVVDDHAARL